jgi:glycosyltransferase involved in cell wall biosynthesis
MSILYIITQADGGGAQKYVLQMAKAFKGAIAAGTEASQLFADANKSGIPVFPLKYLKRSIHPLFDLLALFEIRSLIQKIRPDIVHLNSSKAGVLGSIAAWGTGTKVVFTAHGFVFLEPASPAKRNFFLALEKIASDFRDFIITVSDADRKAALEHRLIAPEKIKTIHNGLEKIEFKPANQARAELGLPEDKKILFTIANDYPVKGLDTLEKFANDYPIPGTVVAVLGYAPNRRSTPNIKFLGVKANAAQYLSAATIVVIPSHKEGFPFVALEAMQAGLPIIATKVGGIPEALGTAGILIAPDNPQALAEAIKAELADESKIKSDAQKSRERGQEFTIEKTIEQTRYIYEKLLKPRA